MAKKNDLPAMPFYPGDWLKCPEVRSLPLDYRALWFDLLCFMWESTERGVMVKPNGKAYTDNEIIRMVGLDNQNSGIWLTSLLENEVCSRRESDGAIFSRRMVRDEEIRAIRKESGSKGGNPKLKNKNLVNHKDNQKVIQNTEDENENENENKKEIERENKGGVGGKPKWAENFKNFNPEIIYPFEYDEFGRAWDLWFDFRREKRLSKYKQIGEQAALKNLSEISHGDLEIALKIIHQSIANNWQGLFELKKNGGHSKNQSLSFNEIEGIVSAVREARNKPV